MHMLPIRDPPQNKRPTHTESEWLEKGILSKQIGKIARVVILTSNKIDFKRKITKRDTEGHFIILKGRIHQEDINIVNVYAPNIGTPKYIRKSLRTSRKI